MNFDTSILKPEELATFALRALYVEAGYKQFKMSKFEEYDLYSKNKDFLVSDGVITFTDTDGKLLALKPDVTLSIIKSSKDTEGVSKYFYDENVYRISKDSHSYKEIRQTGLECIGSIGCEAIKEVLSLALASLSRIFAKYKLSLSSVALVDALLAAYGIAGEKVSVFYEALKERNLSLLSTLCEGEAYSALSLLFRVENDYENALAALKSIAVTKESLAAVSSLEAVLQGLPKDAVSLDFSITSFDGYYNGVVFKGFVDGIASPVLSGGQYDKLMKKMGRKSSAIGFAVYMDTIAGYSPALAAEKDEYIHVALPKGRLGEKIYEMFEKAGYPCPEIREKTRRLIYENSEKKIRFFWVKPSDVSIYVERGAADIGVAGKDILAEYAPDVYELLDLKTGKCRMAVAGKTDFVDDESKTLRVATKFSRIAKEYYAAKGRDIEIIHLNGSIELAPLLSLSDVIVDIVETGKTLLENGLIPFETILPISARLIANKASYSFKGEKIEEIKKELAKLLVNEND